MVANLSAGDCEKPTKNRVKIYWNPKPKQKQKKSHNNWITINRFSKYKHKKKTKNNNNRIIRSTKIKNKHWQKAVQQTTSN